MLRAILASVLLLCACAAGWAKDGPAGRYRLTGEPHIASALILRPDGHFQYFLSEGALDEQAEGVWETKGHKLSLTTRPKPLPPSFSAGPAKRTSEAPLTVAVKWPDGRGIALVNLRIGFDTGEPVEAYTQEDGWKLPTSETRKPRWIELAVPMHGLASPRFPIDADRANALTFVLTPNDLGKVDFDGLLLERQAHRLMMRRGGRTFIYVAED